MAPDVGMRKHPGMCPENSCRRIRGRGEAGGGRLGYHPERRGGDEMSWLPPPAPAPWVSLKGRQGPPLQEWRGEGGGRYTGSWSA